MPGKIGINIAWYNYDADFGATRPPPWASEIDDELYNLKSIGIEVIRWWLLGSGANYPPWPVLDVRNNWPGWPTPRFYGPPDVQWLVGTPSALSDAFKDDFRLMLTKVARAGLQVIPCLIDFKFCQQRDFTVADHKGKRYGYLTDDAKANLFLHNVLEPLVEIVANEGCTTANSSVAFKDVVLAFDVMNEPEWSTATTDPLHLSFGDHPVPYDKMVSFLRKGCQMISDKGKGNVKSTVGFADTTRMFHDTTIPAAIRQVHIYAHHVGSFYTDRELTSIPGTDTQGVIIGEVADDTEPDRYTAGGTPLDVTGRLVSLLRAGAAAVLLWPSNKQTNFNNQGFPYRTLTDYEKEQIRHAYKIISGKP